MCINDVAFQNRHFAQKNRAFLFNGNLFCLPIANIQHSNYKAIFVAF